MINDKYEALKIVYNKTLDKENSEDFREAVNYLRDLEYPIDVELKRIKEEDENFQKVCDACDRLFEILKEFSLLKTGKFDEELEEIKEVLKKDDSYVGRTLLYEKLLELPKYARLEKEEKIVLAMKLGALDSRDLSYSKKFEEE